MKTVIEMACEAGAIPIHKRPKEFAVVGNEALERFAELVRADERKKWEGQTAVEIHEAVLDEREACARIAEEPSTTTYECTVACGGPAQTFTQRFPKHSHDIAKEIRARGWV